MINILLIGDIVGNPGRNAIKKLVPELRKKYSIDLCIANADNLTHGIGTTRDKIEELQNYGVDFFTSGDHIYRFKNFYEDLDDQTLPIIRPANFPENAPGRGYDIIDLGAKGQILVINLLGQVFIKETVDSPFHKVDEILKKFSDVHFSAIIVDLHAEATSEKRALGFYLDGQVSLLVGTHTHVPTADAQILPKGTGYVSDLGMAGVKDSILGENVDSVLEHFLIKTPHRYTLAEKGFLALGGAVVTIDAKGKTKKIKKLDEEISE